MIWSILIAGIPERYHLVQPLLLSILEHQSVARMPDVELLYLLDNRRRSVGAKRNALLGAATGEYISYIDDDDSVSNDYVQKIYREICKTRKTAEPADVICFPQRCTLQPAGVIHECTYSLAHWKDRAPEARRQLAPAYYDRGKDPSGKQDFTVIPNTLNWSGPPAHTMVWRRAILEGLRFPEKQFGEDVEFVDQACERAKHEIQIPGPFLYHYRFDEQRSATR